MGFRSVEIQFTPQAACEFERLVKLTGLPNTGKAKQDLGYNIINTYAQVYNFYRQGHVVSELYGEQEYVSEIGRFFQPRDIPSSTESDVSRFITLRFKLDDYQRLEKLARNTGASTVPALFCNAFQAYQYLVTAYQQCDSFSVLRPGIDEDTFVAKLNVEGCVRLSERSKLPKKHST